MERLLEKTAYALTIGSHVKIQDVIEIIKSLFTNHLFP